jgi:hypothetical protein
MSSSCTVFPVDGVAHERLWATARSAPAALLGYFRSLEGLQAHVLSWGFCDWPQATHTPLAAPTQGGRRAVYFVL